jgi:anaerobic selenocysteine-containing dehydrogenase
MICWGLGGFGLGLTGHLETNTKEDMSAHAQLILLWGANLASQPNTARHVIAARRRGAHVVTIDVRETEAAAQSDETLIVRPGSDAALALGMMHVLVTEKLWDRAFVEGHTVGFDALAAHVAGYTPARAAEATGVPAERIVALARRYATTKPAMIVVGGSSMHKSDGSWTGARAIGCLPALTGNVGIPGGGFGPRHGSASHGQGLTSITAEERRPAGAWIPSQMPLVTEAMLDGRLRVMLLLARTCSRPTPTPAAWPRRSDGWTWWSPTTCSSVTPPAASPTWSCRRRRGWKSSAARAPTRTSTSCRRCWRQRARRARWPGSCASWRGGST